MARPDAVYHSTRGDSKRVTSKEAILAGLAPDSGLYVSDAVLASPIDLDALGLAPESPVTYLDQARLVLARLLPDFGPAELEECCQRAYGGTFATDEVVSLTPLGDDWRLELFHGPTCAFKDVALQMLPQLMGRALAADAGAHGRTRVLVLTATSGDTGKAALAGFADVADVAICVLYPAGKVSDVQRLQMVTQAGSNVAVTAVAGSFDDAQTAAKLAFGDRALAERLGARAISLSSANSINVGRLVPQVVYYAHAWAELVRQGTIARDEAVDFLVPTGNFGDIFAGYMAKQLGVPVGRLVICANANNVLCDFLATGTYDRRRELVRSISPSMDILVSSNLERLLYFASGGDVELVASLMGDLAEKGRYRAPEWLMERIRADFAAGSADDVATRAAIERTWRETGELIDPHTAVGAQVMDAMEPQGRCRVLLSTASPYKFPQDVLEALGQPAAADGFSAMEALSALTSTAIPPQLAGLRDLPVRFEGTIEPAATPAWVEAQAKALLP